MADGPVVELEPDADVGAMLHRLRAAVATARALPMSASCVINRDGTLRAIDAIVGALPRRLAAAEALLAQSATLLQTAASEAEGLLVAAGRESERLLAASRVGEAAAAWAGAERARAETEVAGRRAEVEEFVDRKLAALEAVLEKTLSLIRLDPGTEALTVAEIEARLREVSGAVEGTLLGVRRGRADMHARRAPDGLRSVDDVGADSDVASGGRLGTREELR